MNEIDSQKPFRIREAITQPFHLPGGISFLLRLGFFYLLFMGLLFFIFGRAILSGYLDFFLSIPNIESPDDPAIVYQMMSSLFGIMLPMLAIGLGSWVLNVSTETAFHRNLLRPKETGFFPLRFGLPELRVALAQIVVGAIVSGVYMAGYLIFVILVVLAGFSAQSSLILGVIFGVVAFAVLIAWIGAMLTAAVRLGPAPALSVRDAEIRTVEGWNLTKGLFWPMLGSYLLIGFIVYTISMGVALMGLLAVSAQQSVRTVFAGMENANLAVEDVLNQMMSAFSEPGMVVLLIAMFALSSCVTFMWRVSTWGVANYVVQIRTPKRAEGGLNNED